MSYRFYDDYYYYNPAREKAIAKNESLVSLGERMKTSMCRIGQKKVKLFLNRLPKKNLSLKTRLLKLLMSPRMYPKSLTSLANLLMNLSPPMILKKFL